MIMKICSRVGEVKGCIFLKDFFYWNNIRYSGKEYNVVGFIIEFFFCWFI